VFKESVEKLSVKYPLIRAINRAINVEGLKLIMLLRLSPLIPFNFLNYLMGITDIKLWHYVLGMFGMIPGTLVFVFIGTTISNITDAATGKNDQGAIVLVMVIVGSILACGGIVYVSFKAKGYLNEFIAEDKEEADG